MEFNESLLNEWTGSWSRTPCLTSFCWQKPMWSVTIYIPLKTGQLICPHYAAWHHHGYGGNGIAALKLNTAILLPLPTYPGQSGDLSSNKTTKIRFTLDVFNKVRCLRPNNSENSLLCFLISKRPVLSLNRVVFFQGQVVLSSLHASFWFCQQVKRSS